MRAKWQVLATIASWPSNADTASLLYELNPTRLANSQHALVCTSAVLLLLRVLPVQNSVWGSGAAGAFCAVAALATGDYNLWQVVGLAAQLCLCTVWFLCPCSSHLFSMSQQPAKPSVQQRSMPL
jgi:hypothetical protein